MEYRKQENGNIHKSIEINAGRFGLSKQLKSIFENTANYLWTSTLKQNKEKE